MVWAATAYRVVGEPRIANPVTPGWRPAARRGSKHQLNQQRHNHRQERQAEHILRQGFSGSTTASTSRTTRPPSSIMASRVRAALMVPLAVVTVAS